MSGTTAVSKIKRAEAALIKLRKLVTLTDNLGRDRGKLDRQQGKVIIRVAMDGAFGNSDGTMSFSIDTLEKWVKQAKSIERKSII